MVRSSNRDQKRKINGDKGISTTFEGALDFANVEIENFVSLVFTRISSDIVVLCSNHTMTYFFVTTLFHSFVVLAVNFIVKLRIKGLAFGLSSLFSKQRFLNFLLDNSIL